MTSKAETKLCNKMRDRGRKDYAERLVIVKNHGTEFSRAGVSDFTGCLDGLSFAIEVKAPDSPQHKRKTIEASIDHALRHGPTVLQRAFVQHVLDAGGCAGFAATIDQFNEILDHAAERADSGTSLARTGYCTGHNILEVEP